MVKAKTTKTLDKGDKFTLVAQPRTIVGKKVKKLRDEGLIPGNVFGNNFKSQAVSLTFKDFSHIYKKAKKTGIVYLTIGKDEIPTLIKNVQRHPVDDHILHVDLRKIDLSQKIETEVPVKIVGTSMAVTQKAGVLLHLSPRLKVEALPQDIPQEIEVDITGITELGQEFKVSSLKKNAKYDVKELPDKVIVSVVEHKEEEITPVTTAPETVVTTGAPPAEGEAAPVEGAKPGAPAAKPTEAGKQTAPAGKPAAAPPPKTQEGKK